MIEAVKEKNFVDGLKETHDRAVIIQKPVLFSYTVRFDVRDVLPLLTHPSDKNTTRVYVQYSN